MAPRLRSRAVVIAAAALAFIVHVALTLPLADKNGPQPVETGVATGLALTLARDGFRFETSHRLTSGGGHKARIFGRDRSACKILVLHLDPADEVMTLARRVFRPAAWERRALWLDGPRGRVDAAWKVHALRLWTRLVSGTGAADPYLVVPSEACARFEIEAPGMASQNERPASQSG